MRIPTEPFREEQFVRTVHTVSMLILLARNQRVQMIEKSELLRLIEVGVAHVSQKSFFKAFNFSED